MARPILTPNEINNIKIKLIDAAIKIIKQNGFDSVSIKSVSSNSKINSAIVYKYFKNLDELIIYAYVDKFYNYYDEIAKVNFKEMDSVSTYITTWEHFSNFSYDNKEIIDTLFFEGKEFDLNRIINDYSMLYKKQNNITNEYILNMLAKNNLYERNFQVLRPILNKIYNDDEISVINKILINNFQVELKNLIHKKVLLSKKDFVNTICYSNDFLINSLLKK